MLAGVMAVSVASVYVWGVPLLEKRQSQANVDTFEQSAVGVYNTIVDVRDGGQGETGSATVSFQNIGAQVRSVEINETLDYIDVEIEATSDIPYPANIWSPVSGRSMQNVSVFSGDYAQGSRDQPGVVIAKPAGTSSQVVTYRIEFRNLLRETASAQGKILERVDLVATGATESAGPTTLRFSNQGTEMDTGNDAVVTSDGQRYERRRTVIRVVMR